MTLSLVSYPQFVFRQASAPAAVQGRLWIDTDNDNLYYCGDGVNYTQLNISLGSLQTPILENTLAILEVFAADTLTAVTSAAMTREVFSDATGYLNTVDTGNTTSGHAADKYLNAPDVITQDAHSQAMATQDTTTTFETGIKITTNFACTLTQMTRKTGVTGDTAYLLDASKAVIASASWVSNVATFNEALANATSYYVANGNADDSNCTSYRDASIGAYPIADTNVDWISGLWQGGDNTDICNIQSITTKRAGTPADTIVQTNMQTLSFSPTFFQVYAYKKSLAGTGSVTADISFDNGSNYQAGIALDTATAITNTGSQMILKLNLDGVGAGNTSEAKGYGVLYW